MNMKRLIHAWGILTGAVGLFLAVLAGPMANEVSLISAGIVLMAMSVPVYVLGALHEQIALVRDILVSAHPDLSREVLLRAVRRERGLPSTRRDEQAASAADQATADPEPQAKNP